MSVMAPSLPRFGLASGLLLALVVVVGACAWRSGGEHAAGQGQSADLGPRPLELPASSPTTVAVPSMTPTSLGAGESGRPMYPPPSPSPANDIATVRVDDPVGDPTGGRAPTSPDLVDLRSVTVTVDESKVRIDYELVEAPPFSRGPSVLNLVTFIDTDCDGTTDHELWATLTDRGWQSSAFARTDGGAMAVRPTQNMDVRVSEHTVVLTANAPGDTTGFAWIAAAEDGLVADYKSGDTWRDLVPDSGVAHIGTCTPAIP